MERDELVEKIQDMIYGVSSELDLEKHDIEIFLIDTRRINQWKLKAALILSMDDPDQESVSQIMETYFEWSKKQR